MDDTPMVKKGKKLGSHFCIVSIFSSFRGSVRVTAYSTERSMEYYLFLSAPMLEDLDIRKVPKKPKLEVDPLAFRDYSKTDEQIEAENKASMDEMMKKNKVDWEEWSAALIDRLMLSPQGDLVVGPSRLMENGLSRNFCLTGRDLTSKEEAASKPPSRVHVRKWFDM